MAEHKISNADLGEVFHLKFLRQPSNDPTCLSTMLVLMKLFIRYLTKQKIKQNRFVKVEIPLINGWSECLCPPKIRMLKS